MGRVRVWDTTPSPSQAAASPAPPPPPSSARGLCQPCPFRRCESLRHLPPARSHCRPTAPGCAPCLLDSRTPIWPAREGGDARRGGAASPPSPPQRTTAWTRKQAWACKALIEGTQVSFCSSACERVRGTTCRLGAGMSSMI